MLQDPENTEDWTLEVSVPHHKDYETMKAAAERTCLQELQEDELSSLIDVQQRTKTPNAAGQVKWICKFRSEVSSNDNHEHN